MRTRPLQEIGAGLTLLALVLPLSACSHAAFDARPAAGDEAAWAIRCSSLRGPDRQRQAEACAAALRRVSGLKPERVQIIDTGEESVVYYGSYRREYDAARGEHHYKPNHLPDLELIRSLSATLTDRPTFPFIYATIEELPAGPTSRAEWNLANAMGYWSLQVAVFFNDETITNRRYLAEEYCKELRGQGVEAYFHHGSPNSIVTVGMFPKAAVQAMTRKDPYSGAVSAANVIVDQRLLDLQQQFPYNLENGRRLNDILRDPKTGEVKQRIPHASFLVKTPKAEQAERGAGGGG